MNRHNKEVFHTSDEKLSVKDDVFVIKIKKGDNNIVYIGEHWSPSNDITSARVFLSKRNAKLALKRWITHPIYSGSIFFIDKVTRITHYSTVESEAQEN